MDDEYDKIASLFEGLDVHVEYEKIPEGKYKKFELPPDYLAGMYNVTKITVNADGTFKIVGTKHKPDRVSTALFVIVVCTGVILVLIGAIMGWMM